MVGTDDVPAYSRKFRNQRAKVEDAAIDDRDREAILEFVHVINGSDDVVAAAGSDLDKRAADVTGTDDDEVHYWRRSIPIPESLRSSMRAFNLDCQSKALFTQLLIGHSRVQDVE